MFDTLQICLKFHFDLNTRLCTSFVSILAKQYELENSHSHVVILLFATISDNVVVYTNTKKWLKKQSLKPLFYVIKLQCAYLQQLSPVNVTSQLSQKSLLNP